MDIHKPKAWHSLREFLKEYLIIVIGVLTALGAEQTVETLHTHAELAEAREALRAEVTTNALSLRFAVQEDRCYLAAMDFYAAWAKGGAKAPDVISAVQFPGVSETVWDEVKSGAVLHMPLKERLAYAQFYGAGENMMTLVAQDRALAGEIAHATASDTLDAADAKALLKAAVAGRPFLRIKISQGEGMMKQALALGVELKPRGAQAQSRLEHLCGMVRTPVTG